MCTIECSFYTAMNACHYQLDYHHKGRQTSNNTTTRLHNVCINIPYKVTNHITTTTNSIE